MRYFVVILITVIIVTVTAGELFYYYNKRPRDILSVPTVQKFLSWVKNLKGLEFDGISFVKIMPGEFVMGSEPSELGHQPQMEVKRKVTISDAFALSVYEISESQYWHIVDPAHQVVDGKGNKPIAGINWNEAVEFCKILSEKHGKQFRLPKESEWEYAAKGGENSNRMFGVWEGDYEKKLENYKKNNKVQFVSRAKSLFCFARNGPHDIGVSKKANAFGLFDMHGNVWEWCDEPGASDPDDARSLYDRPVRGGGWASQNFLDCRSARRAWERYDMKKASIGFRVLLENP
ncbi:MAG: formylglycine-generating enzyme family protein [Colwellia sp.]|nr:formylglycine-generating enzyme family protein [Colwellia sp.]